MLLNGPSDTAQKSDPSNASHPLLYLFFHSLSTATHWIKTPQAVNDLIKPSQYKGLQLGVMMEPSCRRHLNIHLQHVVTKGITKKKVS